MKTIIKLSFLVLTLFVFACSDPCDDVICGSNGTCDDGTCICAAGYSGTNCETNICDTTDCVNGDCNPTTGECSCNEGYEGSACDTEIRAKYIGTYSGSLESCLASIPGGEALPTELLTIQAVTAADGSDINKILLNTPNPLLMLDDVSFDPEAGIFIIPTTTQNLDIPNIPLPISITANGNGKFIDENTLEISLSITITLLPAIQCTITMNKV